MKLMLANLILALISLPQEDETVKMEIYDVQDIIGATLDQKNALVDVIRKSVSPKSWEERGRSLVEQRGLLVIKQTEKVHAEITEFLQKLRESTGRLVSLELTLVEGMAATELESIGIDVLGKQGEASDPCSFMDSKSVETVLKLVKKKDLRIVTAPKTTVFNTQRASIKLLRDVYFFKAGSEEGTYRLARADEQEGLCLLYRPILSADGKYVTLEIDLAYSMLEGRRPLSTAGGWEVGDPKFDRATLRKTVTLPNDRTLGWAFRDSQGRSYFVLVCSSLVEKRAPKGTAEVVLERKDQKSRFWTGAVDDDWYNPQNWNPEGVPGLEDRVVIKRLAEGGRYPIVRKAVHVWALEVQEGTTLKVEAPIIVERR